MAHAILNNDPFCEVKLANIEHQGRSTDKYLIEMETEDDHDFTPIPGVSTVHSADYQLVTNQQVFDMGQQVIERSGIGFKPLGTIGESQSAAIYWNGRQFAYRWFSEDRCIDMPDGTNMMLGMQARNSYDGSCGVSLSFFMMRYMCRNQFYSNNLLGQPFSVSHLSTGGHNDAIANLAGNVVSEADRFLAAAPKLKQLSAERIGTFKDFLAFREDLKTTTGIDTRDKFLLDEIAGRGVSSKLEVPSSYDSDDPTYWDLANAYTAITTHHVGGFRGADQSRRVTGFHRRLGNYIGADMKGTVMLRLDSEVEGTDVGTDHKLVSLDLPGPGAGLMARISELLMQTMDESFEVAVRDHYEAQKAVADQKAAEAAAEDDEEPTDGGDED